MHSNLGIAATFCISAVFALAASTTALASDERTLEEFKADYIALLNRPPLWFQSDFQAAVVQVEGFMADHGYDQSQTIQSLQAVALVWISQEFFFNLTEMNIFGQACVFPLTQEDYDEDWSNDLDDLIDAWEDWEENWDDWIDKQFDTLDDWNHRDPEDDLEWTEEWWFELEEDWQDIFVDERLEVQANVCGP